MTCCNHNCNEGRTCPQRATVRPFRPIRYLVGYLSVYLRWFDHAAAKRAGHLATLV